MAVSSLRYRPGAQQPEESKFGHIVFDGRASEYHDWTFRTNLKLKTAKKDEDGRPLLGSAVRNVVENFNLHLTFFDFRWFWEAPTTIVGSTTPV